MKAIKVLHLIPTLQSGGAECQLVNLIKNSPKEKLEHVVCVISDASFFGPTLRNLGCKVIEFNLHQKHPFFTATRKFAKVVKEENPDIIHSWLYDANIVSRLAKLFYPCKAPILTSLQCPDYDPETIKSSNWNSKKILALKLIDKITAVLTNPYFVACSYSTKDSYQKHYGLRKEKAVVIYNSYDETRLKTCAEEIQKLREEIRLAQESFVFLSVGRLSPQKNHENLIKAFAKLLEQTDKRKLVLLIAGVGNLEENLKELTKGLGIEEKVLFLGRRSDIGALLEIADVFVFPSFFEGLPIALIEAMSKGVPCVVSRISVFEEIVEDGKSAIFVDPNSPEEIKEAMLKLYLDEKLRESLGREAFKVVTEKFGDNLIKEWIDLYSRIKCES